MGAVRNGSSATRRKPINRHVRREWREFALTAAVALLLCGLVQFLFRVLVWKLADTTYVLADWPGFVEVATANPLGFMDWIARLLCATGLTWGGGLVTTALLALAMVTTFLIRGMRPAVAVWLPVILFAVPLLNLGDQIWLLKAPHFLQWNLLWYVTLAAALAVGGRYGAMALLGALVVVLVGAYVVCDLPFGESAGRGFGIYPGFSWLGGDFVALGVFAVLIAMAVVQVEWTAKLERGVRYGMPVVLVVLTAALWAKRDCRDQLTMERLVRERKFDEVLKVAPRKARPERMETAWRILAMYRTDRLDRDLFRYPIIGSHANTDEEEMIMEGTLYLFEYGLIQPCRRWIFESLAVKGWQPDYLRQLGEGAIVAGDAELAKRNFRQLMRCPFRGDQAAKRLAALEMEPPPPDAFDDLADVAGMFGVWQDHVARSGTVYFGNDRIVERFVYSLFMTLESCPPPMLKMLFASALLSNNAQMLKDNSEALSKLYPDGRIGPVFLEALR